MSIFNILPLQKIFKGCIKVNDNHFGFFSVKYKKVTLELSPAFDDINQNLRKKNSKEISFSANLKIMMVNTHLTQQN